MLPPTVSVAMSVYNGEAFLREALESVLSQTFPDFEFIIIDDGSIDGTGALLSSYANRDARIRLLSHENQGRVTSLNKAIGLARGKYIARMDADDISLPQRLAQQVAFMDRHAEIGLLCGSFELMSADGKTLRFVQPPLGDADIRAVLLRCNPFCHPAVMMRKEVVLAAGGYRKALLDVDDYDLWLRISERSKMAGFTEQVLRYRVHRGQVSVRNMRQQTEFLFAAQASAAHRRQGKPDPLSSANQITPEILSALGVTERDVQRYLAGAYEYWIALFQDNDPEAAIELCSQALPQFKPEFVGRGFLGNEWIRGSQIHRRLGHPGHALYCALQAVRARPIVAGRPLKAAFRRLMRNVKN